MAPCVIALRRSRSPAARRATALRSRDKQRLSGLARKCRVGDACWKTFRSGSKTCQINKHSQTFILMSPCGYVSLIWHASLRPVLSLLIRMHPISIFPDERVANRKREKTKLHLGSQLRSENVRQLSVEGLEKSNHESAWYDADLFISIQTLEEVKRLRGETHGSVVLE